MSDERTGLQFTFAAGPRQRSHIRTIVPRDSLLFTVSDLKLTNLEGQVPVFLFSRNTWPSYSRKH
jgi:hypothetical protein